MKINVLSRCEDSSAILVDAKDEDEAEAIAAKIAEQPHVLGCRLKTMAGDKAVLAHVAKFGKGEYSVPQEVGEGLIKLGLAEEA